MRRDFTVDCLADTFALAPRGDAVLVASAVPGAKALFEFVPPVGGMFIWVRASRPSRRPVRSPRLYGQIKLRLENHPAAVDGAVSPAQADALEREIWTELAEDGLLVTPGWYFNAAQLKGSGHFRLSFSYTDVRPSPHHSCVTKHLLQADEMRKALAIFARVIWRVFGVAEPPQPEH